MMSSRFNFKAVSMIALSSALAASPANAVLLKINGTTVFNEGFEGSVVGSQPSVASPGPGTWSLELGGTSSSPPAVAEIYGPASGGPGAAFGNNYLHGFRPADGVNHVFLFPKWAPTVAEGDTLYAEMWLWINQATDFGVLLGWEGPDLGSTRVWLATTGADPEEDGTYRLLVRTGGNNIGIDGTNELADVSFTLQQWQKWTMEWVVGSSSLTFSVDGVSETRSIIPGPDVITQFRLGPSNWPSTFYVDGESLAPPPSHPGDFDGDGDVDGADFVVWQTNFPTASGATLADGDADGDGDVDGADFVVWQTNFPFTPSPSVAPVPEPASWMLALPALIGLRWRKRAFRDRYLSK